MPERAAIPRLRSVRFRLLAIALLPTLVILPLLLGVTVARWQAKFDNLLITKVNSDLTVARQYLARMRDAGAERVEAFAGSVDLAQSRDPETLLEARRAAMGLDFLYFADRDGRAMAASPPGARPGIASPIIASALAGQAGSGITILSNADLARIAPDLAARARLPLVPTPNAVPTDRREEDRGMVILSAAPARWPDGRQGVLIGGTVLNQNLGFIDTVNDLVYRQGSLPEGSQGTATLFLDDVRITTNVRLFEGRRALGTRVSAEVRARVLDRGESWLDRAFVVNDWYVSAYEPITDGSGARVGMLYVGYLEAPFAEARRTTLLLVAAGFLLVTALTVPIFLRLARGIFGPLEQVTETIAEVEAGDLAARTGVGQRGDEVGQVARHLDHLLDQIQERDAELRRWNQELNARVEETTRKLILSEKLATIGEITAAAAHEINNPVAVIQGNLDLLRDIMGDRIAEAETEFRLLDDQVQRISLIVNRLLQLARPEEYAGWATRTDPRDAVNDCRPLLRHLLGKGGVTLRVDGDVTRQVLMHRTELQQVLINLVINAINAMPDGGEVLVMLRDTDRDGMPGVQITVSDTGTGMDQETLASIFEPFFTTRAGGGGTGLGLSICRTLVERQGGTIVADSRRGEGTTFTLWLPEAR